MTHRFLCFSVVLLACSALSPRVTPAQASPASVPTPTSTATTTAAPEVEQFQKIEDKWSNAVNTRDQYSLELVLAPTFVGIAANGDISTRNQQLADVISDPDKTMTIQQRVVTVRLLGDIAVANGTYVLHHKVGGAESDEKGVFTHVFERQRNTWVCMNSQRTLLREDGATGKNKKKSSDAALPFHIPLFSKGSDKTPPPQR